MAGTAMDTPTTRHISLGHYKELIGVLSFDDQLLRLSEEQHAIAGLMRAACSRRE
jgi:hypothetical protein